MEIYDVITCPHCLETIEIYSTVLPNTEVYVCPYCHNTVQNNQDDNAEDKTSICK